MKRRLLVEFEVGDATYDGCGDCPCHIEPVREDDCYTDTKHYCGCDFFGDIERIEARKRTLKCMAAECEAISLARKPEGCPFFKPPTSGNESDSGKCAQPAVCSMAAVGRELTGKVADNAWKLEQIEAVVAVWKDVEEAGYSASTASMRKIGKILGIQS